MGSYSQFVGPITNPQGFGVVNGVGYIAALDNDGSLWELRDFKFTAEIADQSWTVGTAVSVSAPATEDGETPLTYAISSALPAGVTLNTSTGEISGTPTATADATDYTLTATDDNGIEATTTFSASVAASGGITLAATTLEIVSGNNQSATEGEALTNPLIVQVNDQNGDPFQGATVTFSVSPNDATLGTTTATTDSDGRAQTTLTLGETVGDYTLTASVTDLTDVEFTATATAAPIANNAPAFADSSYAFTDVAIAVNTVVGTVAATDADNDTLSYSLTGTDAGNFSIDSDGEITVATELTNSDTYNFNVVADDQTDTTSVAVTVTAVAAAASLPTFTAPASDYEVNERADATIDSADFFSGHTSLAFDSGYTAPSWITISGLDVIITSAPSVTDDTDYTVELTATNDDGDVDGSITVQVNQIDSAPVIGTLSRIDIDEGESETVDLSGDLQNTDDLVITSGESWVSVSGLSLVITNAPDVNFDTDYTVNLRAESDATSATDTGSVVIRVANVLPSNEIDTASVANQVFILFEKERNQTTDPSEAGDNDRSTSTTKTTVDCDISDPDGNDTEFDHVFVRCSGVTSYEISLDGVPQGLRTLPTEIQVSGAEPAIDNVSIERNDYQHDLLALGTAISGSSVSLTFTGTDIKINEVLILKKSTVGNQNYSSLAHSKIDINSNLDKGQSGELSRTFLSRGDRLRWRSNGVLEFVSDDEDSEVLLDWIDENPNIVVAHDPQLYPWRVYKAKWLESRYNIPYLSKVVEDGNSIRFLIQENRPIGSQLALDRKETFNTEDSKDQYLFFNHCQHLLQGRVTTSSGGIERRASDNKSKTFSTETTLIFDISKNSESTKVTHIYLKATGVTSYAVQTLVSNTWTTQQTLTPTQTNHASWDNSLEKLTTAITATSVRLVFTGSSLKISEVMLLHHAGGLSSLREITPVKTDRSSVVSNSESGERQNRPLGSDRLKWEFDFSAVFTELHTSEDFVDWADANPNFTFAERPKSKPWRVYPATFLNDAFNISLLSDVIQIGEILGFQVGER